MTGLGVELWKMTKKRKQTKKKTQLFSSEKTKHTEGKIENYSIHGWAVNIAFTLMSL